MRKKIYKVNKTFVDSYELPASYNATSLTLIPRDPNWIFAYWEITPSSIESVRNTLGGAFDSSRFVLRMYDVTCIDFNGSNANHWFDLDVGPHANNWYINLWKDNVSYCGEIGIRTPDNNFFPLARSNYVTTPRLRQSPRRDEIWMEANEDKTDTRKEFFVNNGVNEKSNDIKKRDDLKKNREGHPKPKPGRFHLTEDDVRAYYSKFSVTLEDIIRERLKKEYPGMPDNCLGDLILPGSYKDTRLKIVRPGLMGEFFPGASESVNRGASEQMPGKIRDFSFDPQAMKDKALCIKAT